MAFVNLYRFYIYDSSTWFEVFPFGAGTPVVSKQRDNTNLLVVRSICESEFEFRNDLDNSDTSSIVYNAFDFIKTKFDSGIPNLQFKIDKKRASNGVFETIWEGRIDIRLDYDNYDTTSNNYNSVAKCKAIQDDEYSTLLANAGVKYNIYDILNDSDYGTLRYETVRDRLEFSYSDGLGYAEFWDTGIAAPLAMYARARQTIKDSEVPRFTTSLGWLLLENNGDGTTDVVKSWRDENYTDPSFGAVNGYTTIDPEFILLLLHAPTVTYAINDIETIFGNEYQFMFLYNNNAYFLANYRYLRAESSFPYTVDLGLLLKKFILNIDSSISVETTQGNVNAYCKPFTELVNPVTDQNPNPYTDINITLAGYAGDTTLTRELSFELSFEELMNVLMNTFRLYYSLEYNGSWFFKLRNKDEITNTIGLDITNPLLLEYTTDHKGNTVIDKFSVVKEDEVSYLQRTNKGYSIDHLGQNIEFPKNKLLNNPREIELAKYVTDIDDLTKNPSTYDSDSLLFYRKGGETVIGKNLAYLALESDDFVFDNFRNTDLYMDDGVSILELDSRMPCFSDPADTSNLIYLFSAGFGSGSIGLIRNAAVYSNILDEVSVVGDKYLSSFNLFCYLSDPALLSDIIQLRIIADSYSNEYSQNSIFATELAKVEIDQSMFINLPVGSDYWQYSGDLNTDFLTDNHTNIKYEFLIQNQQIPTGTVLFRYAMSLDVRRINSTVEQGVGVSGDTIYNDNLALSKLDELYFIEDSPSDTAVVNGISVNKTVTLPVQDNAIVSIPAEINDIDLEQDVQLLSGVSAQITEVLTDANSDFITLKTKRR